MLRGEAPRQPARPATSPPALREVVRSAIAPGLSTHPDPGTLSGNLHRALALQHRAQAVLEKVRNSCLEATMTRGQTRVQRENRHWARLPEATLPPVEFRFLASDAPWLQEGVAEPPLGLAWDPPAEAASPAPRYATILYVWGYGEPPSLLCRERCVESAAARRFAAEAGWDATRPGAWARELTLPLRLTEVLRDLESDLRRDAGVAGWGARMERP